MNYIEDYEFNEKKKVHPSNIPVYVKYSPDTLMVIGFFLKEDECGDYYIKINKEIEGQVLKRAEEECGDLYIKDIETKQFEVKINVLPPREKTEQEMEIERLTNELELMKAQMTEFSLFMSRMKNE